MTYSRSNRGFRSPRSSRGSFRGRGTFRGRGRGSDSYYGSNRGSFSGGRGSYRGSSFHSREESYDSRGSGSRYGGDRYSSSHSRRDDGSYHHREVRESASGSFGREHSRRSDSEPERKRIRSEIGSYKEGMSPRRYDDIEHSSRSFNTNSSPYRSDSSPFARPHRSKEFSDFKKPLPPDSSFSGRPTRGSRGRGVTRSATSRIIKSSVPSFLRRSGLGRISRLNATSRLQQILRRKKQLRLLRMKKAREHRIRLSAQEEKPQENNIDTSEDELDLDVEEELELEKTLNDEVDESKDIVEGIDTPKVAKKMKAELSAEKTTLQQETSMSRNEDESPVRSFYKEHITLKCIHCKIECATFKKYAYHLTSYKHKLSMESLLYDLKQKLRQMRTEQREQQRIIDEQSNDFAKTSYCRLCKLNYKQTKQEHFTSDFHINLNEFLNPRCSVCRISFSTPILYEQHRCTLAHIKRKAFLEKKGIDVKDGDNDDENNDDDNFMVLDSVGSADESSDEAPPPCNVSDTESKVEKKVAPKKKKLPKVVGAEFIKRVPVYYCKLCRLCLTYNPNRNQEDSLLSHCRGRFHLKRYSLEKSRKTKDVAKSKKRKLTNDESFEEVEQNGSVDPSVSVNVEGDESFWDEKQDVEKSSEDEDDTQAGNRFNRFGHSEENDNPEKTKTVDVNITDDDDSNQNTASSQT